MERKSYRADAIRKLFLLPFVFIIAVINCNQVNPSQPVTARVGADVRAFCVSGSTLFAGTYEIGIFRSTDNGESWTAVNSGLTTSLGRPGPCVLSLAVSGSNIFAGTGYDQGIFLSTDNGESWKPVNSGLPVVYPLTCLAIPALIARGSCIFAGTNCEGIYLSTNNGKSWTDASFGLTSYVCSGYTWKYDVTSFAECECDLFAGTCNGVFRLTHSEKGFIKWTLVRTPVSSGFENWDYTILAVNEKNIFAAKFYGIFLSSDNGASWKPTDTFPMHFGGVETVFACGDGGRVLASSQWDAFLSVNNGASWTPVKSGLSGQDVRTFFKSGNTIFAGTQVGGIFRSVDNGVNWTAVNSGLMD
jgi:photosystem II stability/assembly factor-like uncharacterized protein